MGEWLHEDTEAVINKYFSHRSKRLPGKSLMAQFRFGTDVEPETPPVPDDGKNITSGSSDEIAEHKCDSEEKNIFKIPKRTCILAPVSKDKKVVFGSGITSGKNFSKYKELPVFCHGDDVPSPLETFKDAGLEHSLLKNIYNSGYKIPTPIQKNAIPIILKGRYLIGCSQTGSGKTAAYLIPIIDILLKHPKELHCQRPQAIIIVPTRELAVQIFNESRKFAFGLSLKTKITYGGTNCSHAEKQIRKGTHILVATPGRLHYFLMKKLIILEDLRFLVLDEADRLLQDGFIEVIEYVMKCKTMPGVSARQVIMLSATFKEDLQRLALQYMGKYHFLQIGLLGGTCSDVDQEFYEVERFDKRKKLFEIVEQNPIKTIIFVEHRQTADFLASLLTECDMPAIPIHGKHTQENREWALNCFKSGEMKFLVATNIAARGHDIKNVEQVINYDLPKTIEEYVHRIGRTGRIGNRGRAISFFQPGRDLHLAEGLIKLLNDANEEVPLLLRLFKNMAVVKREEAKKSSRNGDNRDSRLPKPFELDEPW